MMVNGPILCADDESYNLGLLRMALKEHHSLVFARSGRETLLAVAKHRPAFCPRNTRKYLITGKVRCPYAA